MYDVRFTMYDMKDKSGKLKAGGGRRRADLKPETCNQHPVSSIKSNASSKFSAFSHKPYSTEILYLNNKQSMFDVYLQKTLSLTLPALCLLLETNDQHPYLNRKLPLSI